MEPNKCHPGWKAAGMVAMLVTCLLITGGLLFALKGAMARPQPCPPSDRPRDDDKSLAAILYRMRELGLPPPKVESWIVWFTFCAYAMVGVSVAVTMVVVLWLKKACIKARRRSLGHAPEEPTPVHNPFLPVHPASTWAGDQV